MWRGIVVWSCLVLTACAGAPQKSIRSDDRVGSTGFGRYAPDDVARAFAELVSVRGEGYGLLTFVSRQDGRFPGIAHARINKAPILYHRIESTQNEGAKIERGLLILPSEVLGDARQNGATIELCGVGTCYAIDIAPEAFDQL